MGEILQAVFRTVDGVAIDVKLNQPVCFIKDTTSPHSF